MGHHTHPVCAFSSHSHLLHIEYLSGSSTSPFFLSKQTYRTFWLFVLFPLDNRPVWLVPRWLLWIQTVVPRLNLADSDRSFYSNGRFPAKSTIKVTLAFSLNGSAIASDRGYLLHLREQLLLHSPDSSCFSRVVQSEHCQGYVHTVHIPTPLDSRVNA